MSSSNIILSSPTSVTSDAESFYRDYWLQAGTDSPASGQKELRREFIIKKLMGNVAIGSSILELGIGGEGGIVAALRDSSKVCGVDVSDSAINACRSIGIPVFKANCDTQPLPFDNSSFDAVIALEVFEHFANPQFALEQIRRILKPNGLLIVSFPSVYTYHWPRLFYPDLFDKTNFRDFLLVNRFMPTLHEDPFFSNSYVVSSSDRSASLYWQGIRLDDSDQSNIHSAGKELFARKDKHGLRLRPIEELFKQCMDTGPVTLELETDYLSALVYRIINGDTKEFMERFCAIMEGLETAQNRAAYAKSLLAIHHEAEQLGMRFIDAGLLNVFSSMAEN